MSKLKQAKDDNVPKARVSEHLEAPENLQGKHVCIFKNAL